MGDSKSFIFLFSAPSTFIQRFRLPSLLITFHLERHVFLFALVFLHGERARKLLVLVANVVIN